ncbi:MAG: hypothetical protein IKC87_06805 [Clostridia bacterium]|nr:hypothetical protein [Clostridia bacterium]
MLVQKLKTRFASNEPIFTNEILSAFDGYSRAYIFRLINKAEESGELSKFDTGVYFLPTKSIAGTSTITAEDVVNKKYISYKDDVFGVYSGMNLQNFFSVTTQMPNTIEVVSNIETMRCRRITLDGRTVILRKSRCKIDRSNAQAYTVLQLLTEIGEISEIDERAKKSIKKYIRENRISSSDLLSLAKYFPAKTSKNLLFSEVLNDITQ